MLKCKMLVALCATIPLAIGAGEKDAPKPGLPPGLIDTFVPSEKHTLRPFAEITCEQWLGKCGEEYASVVRGTLRSFVPRVVDFDLRIEIWGMAAVREEARIQAVGRVTVKGVKTGQKVSWKTLMVNPTAPAQHASGSGPVQVIIEEVRAAK